ncbi:class I SAM-dependent methyltransferase [Paenibacillus alkaliterrae]|uniref:class I SAM-dependent methyltransferase n=1 Tax=Paenibacillus alkaliterrae TaxID=320909 RepID=UPI001F17B330|nr:class I SAM-dependent methyltransferase [Paenibacillus alkaliterrae]MCF2940396.1 class I SAM-dependent methyltransferase [Paenibacillus alkaliterrae]
MDNNTKTNQDFYDEKPSSYYQTANPNLLRRIQSDANMMILDVGCGEGYLGATLKNMYGSKVYGIEYFPSSAKEAEKKLDRVYCADIEDFDFPFEHNQFDYIIFGDVLEHLKNPWLTLSKVKPYLKPQGSIVVSIPNVGHISILAELISGTWTYTEEGLLDKTHYRFFTLNEIYKMFVETGYVIKEIDGIPKTNPVYEELIIEIERIRSKFNLNSIDFSNQLRSFQYVIIAKKV